MLAAIASAGMVAFHPRGLCGQTCPRRWPHCSVELKRRVLRMMAVKSVWGVCVVVSVAESRQSTFPSLVFRLRVQSEERTRRCQQRANSQYISHCLVMNGQRSYSTIACTFFDLAVWQLQPKVAQTLQQHVLHEFIWIRRTSVYI